MFVSNHVRKFYLKLLIYLLSLFTVVPTVSMCDFCLRPFFILSLMKKNKSSSLVAQGRKIRKEAEEKRGKRHR